MTRLLLSEVKRVFARRMTLLFPAVLAALFVGGVVIAYFVIEGDDDNTPDLVADIAGGVEATELLAPISSLLALMAFVIGASSVGADIKSGMWEQLLTWEPRRGRLLVSRLLAVAVACGVFAALLALFFTGLLTGLASLTGTVDTTGEFWVNVAGIVGRAGLSAAVFSSLGVGVTVLADSSVGSIVGFVVYFFIVENLVGVFLPRVGVFLPVANAEAFGRGGDVQRIEGSVFDEDFEVITQHGPSTAALILVGWAVLAVVASLFVFRARDVA